MYLLKAVITTYFIRLSCSIDVKSIVFVILSQENKYHAQLANNLQENLFNQMKAQYNDSSVIHLCHQEFKNIQSWTILPVLPILDKLHSDTARWVVFLEDYTVVDVPKLIAALERHNHNQETWISHAVHDEEPTIIHHFASNDNSNYFEYPVIASGVAMSIPLVQKLVLNLKNQKLNTFTIDVSHEVALFIGIEVPLKNEPAFCVQKQPHCATFSTENSCCDIPVSKNHVYYAVKTCGKYHEDRVKVIKRTWGPHATKIDFFSDVLDSSIPTIQLDIPNTEKGHCQKSWSILQYVNEKIKNGELNVSWLVLADDDTILSVSRLHALLCCYDSRKSVAIGQKYGYNLLKGGGYPYLTGGAGIVLSIPALQILVEKCTCPSLDSPDDMMFGACMAREGVDLVHSPAFHQARPMDYPSDYLAVQKPISFHKHWNLDPIQIYNSWFQQGDIHFSNMELHDEL
ncbi:unnamed protein product [Callosobruchus maculatus]|uniref:Fringe-like glycosyltransferase domain-containing protein n=1 Tax=Callosobruchus maculatus TaxID=64391 RepID=A0A653BE55_CALMS|nr:unnamed protein product [Callosobruchus maculatus]